MKIIFLRAYDFPLGGAPQNRLLGICKGLVEAGHQAEVHQYAPAKLHLSQNHLRSQKYNSVQIYNHSWKWSPVKSNYHQLIGLLMGMANTIFYLIKSNRQKKIDFIFINSEINLFVFPFFLLAKIFGSKMGRDLNEYPQIVLFPKKFNRIRKRYKKLTNYRWFDVLFVITKNLQDYYGPQTKKNVRFLHLPITVDFDRFPDTVDISKSKEITYCGDLSQSKDGVVTLIKSFALVKQKYPKLHLKLIGSNKDKQYISSLERIILDLGLSDDVTFLGFVNPENIPNELYKSRLLVLSRPDNIQSRGGFPTKLGEYLATGIPVAVTSVGELPDYLYDSQNAFVADPDSITSFAEAMERALVNDDFSKKVGLAGREIAKKYFSHFAQGNLISNFLENN